VSGQNISPRGIDYVLWTLGSDRIAELDDVTARINSRIFRDRAIRAHAQVGLEVCQAIERLGNTPTENLAPEPPINEIAKRLVTPCQMMLSWNRPLLTPSPLRGLLSYFLAPLGRHAFSPCLTAHPAQRHGGGVLAVLGERFLDLARRDPHDMDGVANHVGRTLLAFRACGHCTSVAV
jgi:hypothetical protein